jgi:hypothetical protein
MNAKQRQRKAEKAPQVNNSFGQRAEQIPRAYIGGGRLRVPRDAVVALISIIISIPLTLFLSPQFVWLLSLGHTQSVLVYYVVFPPTASFGGKQVGILYGGKGCEAYMISVLPKEPKDPVKSATIHIHFPSEVASFIYLTDRAPSANGVKGNFTFPNSGNCAVDAPTRGEPPPNIDVRRTGQLRTY